MSGPAPRGMARRGPPRTVIAATIMVAADVAALYSMAAHVAWGWHLLGLGLVFAALAWWVRADLPAIRTRTVLIITAAVQLTGLLVFPLTSDDIYRYVWDARVQLAGVDPYRFVPLDPALTSLRDGWLFPAGQRSLINRAGVPTIYPPGAQLWFTLAAALTPAGWELVVLRLGAVSAVLATTALTARWLGPDRGRALLYGANPLIMIEAGNAGHLDALVALAVAGLCWFATRRRHWLAGLCLGLAASIKLIPLLLVPVFLRSRRWRTSVTAVIMVAVGYLPHVLAVGVLVVGFLPGYWAEEGYGGAGRFALLAWVPVEARTPFALATAAGLAALAVVRSGREPVVVTCCWLYGASFLVATPVYPWYAMPLLVLAIMARHLEWVGVWAACYVAFVFDHATSVQGAAYGIALIIVLATRWRRSTLSSDTLSSGTLSSGTLSTDVPGGRHRLVSDVRTAGDQTD